MRCLIPLILLLAVCTWAGEIHTAIEKGDLAKVTALMQKDPKQLTAMDANGYPPLHLAVQLGQEAIVTYLLDQGAPLEAKCKRYDGDYTPLHLAAQEGRTSIVQLLLARKADVNAKSSNGTIPLHMACQRLEGQTEAIYTEKAAITRLLLDAGADPAAPTKWKRTPLCFAAGSDLLDCVKLLLEYPVEVNVSTLDHSAPPLVYSATNGNAQMVALLLDHGAKVEMADGNGFTPLLSACTFGKIDCAKLLLEKGADITKRDGRIGRNALLWATNSYNTDLADMILKAGADLNCKDNDGNTPLHCAANTLSGAPDMIAWLVKQRVPLDAKNNEGQTALHILIKYDHVKCLEPLLKCGANPNLKDKQGDTPLALAKKSIIAEEMVPLLKKYKAK